MKRKAIGIRSKDRLSSLPDEILVRILSFIPTKQVITSTTLLSKRYRFLWFSLSSLIFHYDGNDGRSPWFTDFIAATLMFNNSKTLDKFSIKFEFWNRRCNGITTVNAWLRYAVMKSVKELHLHLSSSQHIYSLPKSIFENNVVEILNFKGCEFDAIPNTVSWGSLKSFSATDCGGISRDTIRDIVKGSPKIVCLDIIDCHDADRGRNVDYHYEFIRC
ncbi:F-box/FBD/LRR-repeat protein At5g56420-like [Silene latifolia]|uniref:F-box/FBD/LRR-repeat protein At5g56420-like n=1 Tax=Silene latifolia TaxID=37657 RepID=UPI003D77AC82